MDHSIKLTIADIKLPSNEDKKSTIDEISMP
jgi:hypothetical protein